MKMTTISAKELKEFLNSHDYKKIVQRNAVKYKFKWWLTWTKKEENISLLTKVSWNWSAFLFSELWLLYRKMYREFSIIIGIHSVLLLIFMMVTPKDFDIMEYGITSDKDSLYDIASYMYNIFLLIIMIVTGIYGNGWYLRKCLRLADTARQNFDVLKSDAEIRIDTSSTDDTKIDDKNRFLQEVGGSNFKGLLAYFMGCVIVYILIYMGVAMFTIYTLTIIFNLATFLYIYSKIIQKCRGQSKL